MSDSRLESLLVSFCNFGYDPRPTGLLRVDPARWVFDWVDIGCASRPRVSCTGIWVDERYVFHVSIAELGHTTTLSVLDRGTLDVLHVQDLPEVKDGHSVAVCDGELVVVSTGTDELIAYRLAGYQPGDARTVWTPTASGDDTHHINSLTVLDGELVCTAFGPKAGDSWASATEGYAFNVSRDEAIIEGLKQPHSAVPDGGQLHLCNSVLGTVETAGTVVAQLSGYSRGLAFTDGQMYVATSLGRRRNRDPGDDRMFMNPNDQGMAHGRCALVEAPRRPGARLEVGLGFGGSEIYDVAVL